MFGSGVEVDPDNYQAIFRARTVSFTVSNLKAELLTYVDASGAALLNDAQAQKFVDYFTNITSPNSDYVKTRTTKLQTLANSFYAAAGGGDGLSAAINAGWVNFYNKADVLASIANGKNSLAEQLASITNALSTAVTYEVAGGE